MRGFTLVELLVAIAVIGILAAIAIPSFQDSIRKGRRAEAMTAMVQVQQAQERRRTNLPEYASNVSDLGIPATTPSGRYEISLVQAMAENGAALQSWAVGYIAMANGADGTSQAADAQCRRMAVRAVNGNLTYAGCGTCASFGSGDFAINHPCWAR